MRMEPMSNVIDTTNDPAFARLRVLSETHPKLLEFSKTAELSPDSIQALPPTAFAWPEQRQFPIHTPEHTAISAVYAKYAEALPTHVKENIKLACDAHSVDPSVLVPCLEKAASAVHWLLPDESRFRVNSAADVKLACALLPEREHALTDTQKTEAYLNLVKVADIYGVKPPVEARKYAGQTLTSTEVLSDWLDARVEAANKVGHKLAAVEYKNLADAYRGSNRFMSNREEQHKLATCIAELDKVSGVEAFCGRKLPNAILTVWNTDKVAAEQVELNGMFFDKGMLASLPIDFWNTALGADFVAEFAPNGVVDPELLAQILPTLPADMKTTLTSQLSAYSK
jgi:hypothetical protein